MTKRFRQSTRRCLSSAFALLVCLLSAAATYTLWPGETQMIEVDASAGYTGPTWTTTNPTLSLSGSGFYRNVTPTAYFSGTATVTCTYTYRLGTSKHERRQSWTFACHSNNVSASPTSVSLKVGEACQLEWEFDRTAGIQPSMQFTSGDNSVAAVTNNGLVRAVGEGSATVYVRSSLGDNTATCRVTVSGTADTDIPDNPGEESGQTVRTIRLTEAGTLGNYISEAEKHQIAELTLAGPLNGTDLRLLRDMAGSDHNREYTSGKLSVLDLSEAFFVSGGAWYVDDVDLHRFTENSSVFPTTSFAWCQSLARITLPKVTNGIAAWAFNWCKELEYVKIPVGVDYIGGMNFNYADNLKTMVFPSTVAEIETDFYRSDNLTTVYCYAQEPPKMSSSGFSNRTNIRNGTLYVPKGSGDKYWRAEGWSDFGNIVELSYVKYAMRINVSEGGSVRYGGSVIRKDFPDIDYIGTESFDIKGGELVTLDVIPDEGYRIESVAVNGADATAQCDDGCIEIGAIDAVTNVDVRFAFATGVGSPERGGEVSVTVGGGAAVVRNAGVGSLIEVYTMTGAKVASRVSAGCTESFVLPGRGLYVVKVAGQTLKVCL